MSTHSRPRIVHRDGGRRHFFGGLDNPFGNKILIYRPTKVKYINKIRSFVKDHL